MASEEPIVVGHLPGRRIGEAVSLLGDAFSEDPIFSFHFPDPIVRATVLRIFFDNVIRSHMRFRHVYAAMKEERVVGTAVWRPPHAKANSLCDRWREFITSRRLMTQSPEIARKLMDGFAALETTHPIVPHWYLFFIGVDAKLRGRGVGACLMAPVLEAADATRSLCYLETPFSQTLLFYRDRGYEVSSEPRPFPGAPRLWAMTRHPRLQE